MSNDIERGDQSHHTYGEEITYVAISPDGSIVATFNPYGSSILITKVVTSEAPTNEKTEIRFDRKNFFEKVPSNILGWSLAVSDIVGTENNIGLIAFSCITHEDMNSMSGILTRRRVLYSNKIVRYYPLYVGIFTLTDTLMPFGFDAILTGFCALVFCNNYACLLESKKKILSDSHSIRNYVTNKEDLQKLPNFGKGVIKLFKFSFDNINNNNANDDTIGNANNNDGDTSIYKCGFGGAIGFIKNSRNPSNCATLICMNCLEVQVIYTKLNKLNIIACEENDFILPENLREELISVNDAYHNWKYLLKSRYQEFLMVITRNYQQTPYIEIYNINTSQLVNNFHGCCGDEDFLDLNNNKPGIFAISTDSRLFAYSYGDNIITIYLMESGLEVVSKKFDNVYKIKFLEFIKKDKQLFIIEEDKNSDVEFHIWLMSGCLNDYFPISRNDITLSDNDISTLSEYDEYYHALAKANGKIVTLEKYNEDRFKVLSDISIKAAIFGENDNIIDEHMHEYYSYYSQDLEPWNKNFYIFGRFLNNDKRFLLIFGRNSIQLWKSKSQNFKDFKDFKNFDNSNLVYIFIGGTKPMRGYKFQIDDDMVTIITHACESLEYLYNHKHVKGIKSHKKFVNGIINIIKDFIKRYPDNWKLMEVQYPLMTYLIRSRSFPLIKHILFENAEKLHRPQNKYNILELALKLCKGQDAVMLAYLLEYYCDNSMTHVGWMINVTKILPELPANYVELLYYKPCFGGIKYNFPNKRFKELSFGENSLNLKVYMPLTQLKTTKSFSFLKYKIIGDEELHNIYMVPLLNFTTHDTKIEEKSRGKVKTILHWLRKALFPPNYKNLGDNELSPYLRIKKNKGSFFNVPVMEAVIISRWEQTRNYWMIPLLLYIIFLCSFASLSIYSDINFEFGYLSYFLYYVDSIIPDMINTGIFYYAGIYLLIIEFTQMKKYRAKYFTLFNIFDLCSIILGIIVFTLKLVKSPDETNTIKGEVIVILMTVTTLILWIEMLFWLRLFSNIAINIYIFGNILRKIISFFAFMFILIIGFGHSMLVLLGNPSLLKLSPSASTFTLNNGTTNFTLTEESPDNPFGTIWDAIISTYSWNTIDLNSYNYWPLKLFAFFANIILVLVLLNMIIALMNDAFNKAKEDGKLGLLMYRSELINDFERLNDPFFSELVYNNSNDSPYICFYRNPDLMKKWITKSQELKDTKLYSWYNDNVDEEEITFDDGVDINTWYTFITSEASQNSTSSSSSTPDHLTLWF
ncbi:hypothetical protein RhiirA5_429693 [Rhizophagus irregularis]|uniref:Ion transport domain-containing protein n=1 Tax=Rhizophagus irregularis TaxID=588596 RepID=A0A2N0NXY9_9GLOM|nr:hypothetical protein RhiirA5_429693 [Rhizophagus irregularis]